MDTLRCLGRRGVALGLIVGAALLVGMGCSDSGTEPGPGGLQAVPSKPGLTLLNYTGLRVHRLLFGDRIVPLIDWVPVCTDENAIDSGAAQLVAYTDITGYTSGEDVVIYWWHPVPDQHGNLRPDSIRTMVVRTL